MAEPQFVELDDRGMHWLVRADAQPALFPAGRFGLDAWIASGQATVVKSGPARRVYRVELPERRFYLKQYLMPSAADTLRTLVRPSKGRYEMQRARQLARRDLPTITPLALGERYQMGLLRENVLATESLEGCEPLDDYIDHVFPALTPARQHRVRNRLAHRLAELVSRAHDHGLWQTDLHAGNILIQVSDADDVMLHLIDLHTMRVSSALDWPTRFRNLVQLNLYFSQVADRSDRFRFVKAYAASCPDLALDVGRVARQLEARTHVECIRFWRKRDRRCVGHNKYYYFLDTGRAHGHAIRELGPDRFRMLLADPDAPLGPAGAPLLKDSASSTVAARTLELATGPVRVIYKRYNHKKVLSGARHLFRPSPAVRAWIAAGALQVRGLPTPRPIAVMETVRFGLVRHGYFVAERIDGASHLHDHVNEHLAPTPEPDQHRHKRRLVRELARLVRRLHQRQLSQRDLKATNILVAGSDDRPALYLVDLDGLRVCWAPLSVAQRVQNVARLHVSFHDHPLLSRTDRLRFLRHYLEGVHYAAGGWKAWWRQIADATQRKIDQNIRRGRVIT